ncbi:MAG: RsmB/NOP family class I SAM-dependent RNA methyltransferase [Rhodospirillales bacterium]|nr:RsmB/NOP family class I SAM-dependent RNA methyltransferase [Rhodospirillales bacterium]
MKPASRIQTTIDVLEKIKDNTRVPMDSVIGDYMRVRRYIGSKDRNEIAERVYNMARATARLGWWLKKCGADDTPRSRVLLWLMLAEGADEKRLKDLFDASRYAPAELSPQELHYVKLIQQDGYTGGGIGHPDMPESVRVECPPLYEDKLRAFFGADFETEMAAMLEPATLDLRVNTFLADKQKVMNYLEADGVKTTETDLSPCGLRCAGKAYLAKTKAFGKGWIEIQDEGSQLIAHMCDVTPGMQVLDYCAGAGGKTLALGTAMERKGRIVAMDNDERRLKKGRDRYKKAQIADIIEVRSIDENAKWLKRQKGKFDVVLTDVPCSGTGTWRRNPDMRWRVFGPPLEELTAIQAEILDKVAPLVKPGGRLVYATCSLLRDENEDQIERFLKDHEEFEIVPVPENLGKPFMRLTPHRHGTDGFFAAILQRRT